MTANGNGEALRVEHIAKRFGGETPLAAVNPRLSKGEDLALVNELSVYHNMFLNRELVRWPLLSNGRMKRLAREHLEDMGVNVPSVDDEVAKLSGGQRQAIAV